MKRDKEPPDHNSATLPANLRHIIDAIPGFILLFALFLTAASFLMAVNSQEKAEQKNMLLIGQENLNNHGDGGEGQQPAAIGREARGVSRADLMRRAAGHGNHPYFLGHCAFRGVINVGRSLVLKTLAPCESDRLRIRRPGEFADSETVVLCVRCDLPRLRAMGGVCYPDVTCSPSN